MNYLDILLIVPLIIGGWRGFKKGFIVEFFTLMALLVGLYAGIHFSDFMSDILKDKLGMTSTYVPVIAFTLTFLLVGAMVFFGGKVLERGIKAVALGALNRVAGLLFGLIKMLYILSALLVILESIDEKNNFIPAEQKETSLLYQPVKQASLKTIPALGDGKLFLTTVK